MMFGMLLPFLNHMWILSKNQGWHVALAAGLVLAPMSYAPPGAQGLPFVPSMAVGKACLLPSLLLLPGKAEAASHF